MIRREPARRNGACLCDAICALCGGGTRGDRGGLSIAALGGCHSRRNLLFLTSDCGGRSGTIVFGGLVRGAPFFALCPAIGLHPAWWHRAPGTYLPDELLVGYIHALDLSPQLMTD